MSRGEIPAGQATINELCDECHELIESIIEKCDDHGHDTTNIRRVRFRSTKKISAVEESPKRSKIPGAGHENIEFEKSFSNPVQESGLIDDGSREKFLNSIPLDLSASAHRAAPDEPNSEIDKSNFIHAGRGRKASEIPDRMIRRTPGQTKVDYEEL